MTTDRPPAPAMALSELAFDRLLPLRQDAKALRNMIQHAVECRFGSTGSPTIAEARAIAQRIVDALG